MNAKYILALILTLQVSMSLCEIPTPSAELVEKYDSLKAVFYQRLLNLYRKVQDAAAPIVEKLAESENGQTVKTFVEDMHSNSKVKAAAMIARGLGSEVTPLVDRARSSVLGVYGHYMRPYIGESLSDTIDHIKVYLNAFMPAE